MEIERLKEISRKVRIDILRMLERAGSGHTGGSLSCVEILVSLYFKILRHDPKNPYWQKRDIFVLSKGHAAPALYAVLAHCGYFPKRRLKTLRKFGSALQGHTSSLHLPGVEFSAGVLGQGLSFINGMALAAKLDRNPRHHYVLLSDAEMQYGQIWQAAQTASHHRLKVCALIDYNQWQIDGKVNEIKNIEPLALKWQSFGWEVFEIDGHDFLSLLTTLGGAFFLEKPQVIICHTVKGKGVSFMEDNNKFHGRSPTKEELERALQELGGRPWQK